MRLKIVEKNLLDDLNNFWRFIGAERLACLPHDLVEVKLNGTFEDRARINSDTGISLKNLGAGVPSVTI